MIVFLCVCGWGGGGAGCGGKGTERLVSISVPLQSKICFNRHCIKSLSIKRQTTKFTSANFQKKSFPSYYILRIRRLEGKQCTSR